MGVDAAMAAARWVLQVEVHTWVMLKNLLQRGGWQREGDTVLHCPSKSKVGCCTLQKQSNCTCKLLVELHKHRAASMPWPLPRAQHWYMYSNPLEQHKRRLRKGICVCAAPFKADRLLQPRHLILQPLNLVHLQGGPGEGKGFSYSKRRVQGV